MPNYEEAKNWVILIVDDAPDNLQMVETVLKFWGAEVHTADDGVQGLKILEHLNPTLILLDLSMPEMDGWTMLQKVREKPHFANLPIIALTAHAMVHDRIRVFDAGFNGYITKPFILNQFMDEIIKYLDQHSSTQQ